MITSAAKGYIRKVAIIDYGMGNLDSVARAIKEAGGNPVVTSKQEEVNTADCIILPGVGAFADGMKNIRKLGLDKVLDEQVVGMQIPFLGICLGMQLMAAKGHEGGEADGLGWIDGEVIKLAPNTASERIPHIGWNEVNLIQNSPIFNGIDSGRDFYFAHSYHLLCRDSSAIVARTPYCGGFVSAIGKDNIFGVQFHPEKSQDAGLQVLRNFVTTQAYHHA